MKVLAQPLVEYCYQGGRLVAGGEPRRPSQRTRRRLKPTRVRGIGESYPAPGKGPPASPLHRSPLGNQRLAAITEMQVQAFRGAARQGRPGAGHDDEAGCAETCTSGRRAAWWRRTSRKVGTAPWADPRGGAHDMRE